MEILSLVPVRSFQGSYSINKSLIWQNIFVITVYIYRYLTGKIKEGEAHNITCPGFSCSKLVPVDLIETLVSRDMARRYLQFDIKVLIYLCILGKSQSFVYLKLTSCVFKNVVISNNICFINKLCIFSVCVFRHL